MNKDLKKAQELLNITEVHVREMAFKIAENESFMSIRKLKKSAQSYSYMVEIEEIAFSNEDESKKRFHYIFTFAVGIRLVKAEEKDDEEASSLVMIEAKFDACYLSNQEVSKDQLDAFSQNNAGYHIWPYWREFVQSSCTRAGISPIRIPFFQFSKEPQYKLKEDSE